MVNRPVQESEVLDHVELAEVQERLMTFKPVSFCVLFGFCIVGTPVLRSQTNKDFASFVRDANRPFVYLRFDHIASGMRRNEDEPALRVWLHFVNNSNVPIKLRVYGVPDGGLPGEVGVMDEVVVDPPMLMITADSAEPEVLHQPASETRGSEVKQTPNPPPASRMPMGYSSEVSGAVTVGPGESTLFSVPIDHLGSRANAWHMEIPFSFRVPKGQGPRDSTIGGEPIMSLHYHYYDLPEEAKTRLLRESQN